MNILMYSNPATGLEGRFSLEFCMAVALLDRRLVRDDFSDARVNEPRVREMIRRVGKHPDPDVPHHGGRGPSVTVRLRDGREFTRRMDMAEDQPWTPPTDDERVAKYRDCAKRVLDDRKIEACLQLTQNLEAVSDIREILAVVAG